MRYAWLWVVGLLGLLWIRYRLSPGSRSRGRQRRMMRRELRRSGYGSGHAMRQDGATFWRGAASVSARPSLSPLYGLPGFVRAGIRMVAVLVGLVLVWAWWLHRAALVLGVRITGGMLAAGLVAYGVWAVRTREQRTRRRAMWAAVSRYLEMPPGEATRGTGRKWIRYTNELAEDGEVVVRVPENFLGTAVAMDGITRLMNQRLPGEWQLTPHLDRLYLHFGHPPQPPELALYRDYETWYTSGPEHVVPLGPSARNKMITVDLKGDSPHLAIVAGSGGGKSTQLALQAARFKNRGAERVDILDVRRTSQIELSDVPGIHIHRSVEECIAAISAYRAEVGRRQGIAEAAKQREYSGPRWVLAIEEMSTLTEEIRRHWRGVKTRKDPALPPALDDIAYLASIGRASKITMLVVMQYGSAKMFGGPNVRANFAAFILLRFRAAAWRLVVGTTPIPESPTSPGRGWVVVGESEQLVQLVKAEPDEVVELATSGHNAADDAYVIGDVEPAAGGVMWDPSALEDLRWDPPPPAGEASMDMSIDGGVHGASLEVGGVSGGWTPDVSMWTSGPAVPPADGLDAALDALGVPDLDSLSAAPPAASTGLSEGQEQTIPTGPPAGPPPAVETEGDRHLTLISHPDRIVGWDAAAALLHTERAALVKAADRDKEHFPEGWKEKNRRVWFAADLLAWQAARPIASQRDPDGKLGGGDPHRPASGD